MSTDIVERLRKHSAMGGCYEAEQAMEEAAAEIERLRAALAAERERCVRVAEKYGCGRSDCEECHGNIIAAAIRAME